MRKIIILASLVVCCVAAPTSQLVSNEHKEQSISLQRPSPINPDVPSDPKPDEKIIKITEPKEVLKYKREALDDPYDHISHFAPTAQPSRKVEQQQSNESDEKHSAESDPTRHRQKRDKEEIKGVKKPVKTPANTPTPARKAAVKKDAPKHSSSHDTPSKKSVVPIPAPARDLPKSRNRRQVDPHLIGAASVGVTPLIYEKEDNEPLDNEKQHEIATEKLAEPTNEPETSESTPVKRDIPVPLVPKYQHPEESPKNGDDDDSKSSKSSESDEDSEEKSPAQTHKPNQHIGNPQLAQQHQPIISGPPSVTSNNPVVDLKPAAEHDKPVEVNNNNKLDKDPTNQSTHEDAIAANNDKPVAESQNNAAALDQLATIKPTQIIAYETPASENNIPIKHPVPVAELFSRPKQ